MTLLDPTSQAPSRAASHAAPHRHSHAHGPSGVVAVARPVTFSVLRSSLGARLAFVAGLSAVMWAGVLWVIS
ncbi:hypothetical protein [Roseixanthobacter pseudopolyaromaticivorans]|uniref:hypothetical protein n=1 Tax=Xanthobacteraceae TaxID=335928 RepID=UPI00372BE39B